MTRKKKLIEISVLTMYLAALVGDAGATFSRYYELALNLIYL